MYAMANYSFAKGHITGMGQRRPGERSRRWQGGLFFCTQVPQGAYMVPLVEGHVAKAVEVQVLSSAP